VPSDLIAVSEFRDAPIRRTSSSLYSIQQQQNLKHLSKTTIRKFLGWPRSVTCPVSIISDVSDTIPSTNRAIVAEVQAELARTETTHSQHMTVCKDKTKTLEKETTAASKDLETLNQSENTDKVRGILSLWAMQLPGESVDPPDEVSMDTRKYTHYFPLTFIIAF